MEKIMRINPDSPDAEKLKAAAGLLKDGKIIIYPTDTVYGIGCSIYSKNISKIFGVKKRSNKPLSVAFPDLETLKGYVVMNADQEKFIRENLPEAFTYILVKNERISDEITFGKKVGVRIPNNVIVRELIKNSFPIITTSVNISGEPPAVSVDEIPGEIKNHRDVSLIIDAGRCKLGKPSVVIDLTKAPFRVLRN